MLGTHHGLSKPIESLIRGNGGVEDFQDVTFQGATRTDEHRTFFVVACCTEAETPEESLEEHLVLVASAIAQFNEDRGMRPRITI